MAAILSRDAMQEAMVIVWTRADISNLIGAISLAFWLCNGIPLVYEIWRARSAEGVSIGFVGLWAVGDVLNLAGALWAGLAPTVVVVSIYYIFSDIIILGEAYYFNYIYKRGESIVDTLEQEVAGVAPPFAPDNEADESSALLNDGKHTAQTRILTYDVLFNVAAVLLVIVLGAAGWYASLYIPHDGPHRDHKHHHGHGPLPPTDDKVALGPQLLGYTSAALYLCARIPQILKNYRKQQTEGLALLFFIFSVFGNLTYAASIFAYNSEKAYIMSSMAWIIGSLGTLIFDFIILGQFLHYNKRKHLRVRRASGQSVERESSILNI
ncbi:PQ loop repeat-domain-containing protein [Protomyces lactucae-debilis]|uniref:PQ loop repeat-domain-containing protein n=1 Tax=Protomyces lactucae-debilis TaxID=2754530 RepID=A0A1Y2FHF9_PROLT|nr:PQ loop repeat-domain-containing protein [Protomyces lactucae-debilis]ORY83037.1 PQ loop repeat-domain-containing protein [Protomyces lactucae-debilis]